MLPVKKSVYVVDRIVTFVYCFALIECPRYFFLLFLTELQM